MSDIQQDKDEVWLRLLEDILPGQGSSQATVNDPKSEGAIPVAEALRQGIIPPNTYTLSGVFTPPQHGVLKRAFESRKDAKVVTLPDITTPDGKAASFKTDDNAFVLDIEPVRGPDGYTIDLNITAGRRLGPAVPNRAITTAVTMA